MLYVCPTPIGNMSDMTLRAIDTLRLADIIAAEDTRRTGKLLSHFGIDKPLISFYEHNELKRVPELVGMLRDGKDIALVSDAGMPGLCDPGYSLIRAALDEDLPVEVLPGPSSIETALVASGFPTDSFFFLGYLPRKKGERDKTLSEISSIDRTCVAFEAPHRLRATLEAASEIMNERGIAVCRELSKRYEEITRGTPAQLLDELPEKIRGEIVLVFSPPAATTDDINAEAVREALAQLLACGLSAKRAAAIVAPLAGISRNRAYDEALAVKRS